ncbi:alpha-L-fucosidase [Streptomyces sp. Ag109_G2-15]|uniref:alpha-L-fucosidase n=1 Tax=Streptomyces sp. Ag109_G2-15 TaxID=1938850 RepID=UPI000BC7474D|nr:alpha-L-fucosidase [Streptomyces sp. Ag109_G2-15]SOD91490.1 alpha-L-fucosidase [Streptomyces sp. Ag109_G2-15]
MTTVTDVLNTVDQTLGEGPFGASWESLSRYQVPDWYRDAKFGIFIHWGPYCVPAFGNEWYPRNMYIPGSPEYEHHREVYGPQDKVGYKDLIPKLTGENFDPDAWAALFREAGAQYVVPVAEHHDGFAMYDSALNPWNAVAMGPQRDVVGELAAAVQAQSMAFGLSTHRAEHWWFLNGGMGFESDVRAGRHADLYGPAQPQELPPSPQYLEDWLARTAELVERYQPQLLYFDWWIHQPAFKPYLPKLAAYYYNKAASWQRGPVLAYKHDAFAPGTAVYDVERGASATLRPDPWQADTAVSRTSWGHVEGHDYKSGADLLAFLVDVVSKNGCLLLNVGPKADGSIPEAEVELLREIGAWLAVNGEAIYASRPWVVYGEGPARVKEGQFTENDQPGYGPADLRFTTRAEHLYVTALGGAQDGRIHVRSLGRDLTLYNQRIGAVHLLGHPDPLEFERGPHELTVRLPEGTPIPAMPVLKVSPGES